MARSRRNVGSSPSTPGDRILIERRGGIAGLRATGEIDCSALCAQDLATLDALFERRSPRQRAAGADRYIYILTRHSGRSIRKLKVPEYLLPEFVAAAVTDKLP
jgi:hypothetical protein